jgi:hypothetical protein
MQQHESKPRGKAAYLRSWEVVDLALVAWGGGIGVTWAMIGLLVMVEHPIALPSGAALLIGAVLFWPLSVANFLAEAGLPVGLPMVYAAGVLGGLVMGVALVLYLRRRAYEQVA